jgi:ankyrin repeat protein
MESTSEKAFEAVRTGDITRLQELLAADPSLAGARDGSGVTLRLQALYQRKPEMAALLRDVGPPLDIFEASALAGAQERGTELLAADPGLARAWSGDGFTPLHLAAFFGAPEMAGLLLDRGADPSAVARNPMKVQPLHSAAASRSARIITLLLDHGADVNAQQAGGWTPLHAAAVFGALELVELFLHRGADADQANDDGKKALDLALEKGHAEVAEVLRRRGTT